MSLTTVTHTIDLGQLGEIDCEVSFFFTPEDKGRTYGPPEDCWPAQPAEAEIASVLCKGIDITSLGDWAWLETYLIENQDDFIEEE